MPGEVIDRAKLFNGGCSVALVSGAVQLARRAVASLNLVLGVVGRQALAQGWVDGLHSLHAVGRLVGRGQRGGKSGLLGSVAAAVGGGCRWHQQWVVGVGGSTGMAGMAG